MSDDPLEERLAAVERALTDGDEAVPDLATPEDLTDRVDALEARVAELEAAVQAVRGYVGSVKHVNDEVERRADAAMAKAETLERSLADGADDAHQSARSSTPGSCPVCGGGRQGDGPHPGDRRDESTVGRHDGGSEATADPRRGRSEAPHGGRPVDGSDGPDPGSSPGTDPDVQSGPSDSDHPTGDRPEENSTSEPGRGRVGHRRLEAPDDAGGLLARLREVL